MKLVLNAPRSLNANSKTAQQIDRAYLEDLVDRMCSTEAIGPGHSSTESVSWKAYREAEELYHTDAISMSRDMLRDKRSPRQRQAIYFILGKTTQNTRSEEGLLTLLSQCASETDKNALAMALEQFQHLQAPPDTDTSTLRRLASDKRWPVRHAAISALACSATNDNEAELLHILMQSADSYDIIYAQVALGRIGTTRSLDALRGNLKSRKRDVRISAESAIDAISKRHSL